MRIIYRTITRLLRPTIQFRLLALNEPTKSMLSEAGSAGLFNLPGTQKTYPKIQIYTIGEFFSGKKPNFPEFIFYLKKAKRMVR